MFTHDGFDLESPMGRQALEGMGKGWPSVLDRLGDLLSNGVETGAA